MKESRFGTSVGCVGVFLLMAQASGAQAQTSSVANPPQAAASPSAANAALDSGEVGEIVVTAQRRAESLSRVGETVTAVDSGQLERRDIVSPQDLAKVVPGFQATTSDGGNPVYTLRGVGFNTPNVNLTSPIGLYTDEVALPYPYMSNGLLFDLQRVEALKGPQGTLYGRNATGGLIDFITRKPTDEFEYGGSMEFGNYSTVNGAGFVSGPINEWIRARLAFNSDNRFDGWQKSVTSGETLGVDHKGAGRLTIDIGNGGKYSAEVIATYWEESGDTMAPQAILLRDSSSPFVSPLALASVLANPTSDTQADWNSKYNQPQASIGIIHPAPLIRSDFTSLSAKQSYELTSDIKVVSLTGYDFLHHRDVIDASGLAVEELYTDTQGNIGSISEELRLVGDFGKLDWSGGAYYAHDHTTENDIGYSDQNLTVDSLRYLASIVPQTTYTPSQISTSFGNFRDAGDTATTVAAAFVNGGFQFNDVFKVTAGGRYTEDRTTFAGCTSDYYGGNIPVINIDYPILTGVPGFDLTPNHCYTLNASETGFVDTVSQSQTQHNISWKTSLDVTPAQNVLVYGSVSRGFKAGGFPVLAGSVVSEFFPVKQEELTAYEVGTKLGLFDRRVQLNLSAFYYDYLNKQVYGYVLDPIFGTLSRIENVPKSEEFGAESDLSWRLTSALTVYAAATFLDSKVIQYTGFNDLGTPTNFAGHPFAYTPKYQENASVVYDVPLTGHLRANASVDVAHQSLEHADFAGLAPFEIKPYTLVDATLGVFAPTDKWRATLFVKNMFNTYYWTGVGSTLDTVFRYPGMPREFGVRLSYNY